MITHEVLRSLTHKRWTARAWVDGRPMEIVDGLPTRTLSRLRPRNIAAFSVAGLPPPALRPAQVDLILEGAGSVRFFTGQTAQRSLEAASLKRVVNLIDFLPLTSTIPVAIIWSQRAWTAAVRDLLAVVGVTATQIDAVFDPGVVFAVGPVYPVRITTRETVGTVLQELLDFAGAALITTPTGRIRVINDPGLPAAGSPIVYANGADLATEFGIFNANISLEGNDDLVAAFTATGPRRPDGAVPDGTFTATGIRGRSESRSYRLAQTDAVCQAIAQRELSRRARAITMINVEAALNPLLEQGDSIQFRDASIGFPSNTPAIIEEIATTGNGAMRLTISTGPSLVIGYGTSIQPPVVDFATTIEQQLINIAGTGLAQRAQVQVVDQSRDRQGFALTSRTWTAAGVSVTPTTASTPRALFSFDSLDGAEITLSVTSASGESATLTRRIQALETQTLTRTVSVAAGSNGWRVLSGPDGWRSWSGAGAACTAVPSINDRGGLLAGFANGRIYRDRDGLRTAPEQIAALAGAIATLFVNEGDPAVILAGHGQKLSISRDSGQTWREIADLGETVADVQSSPANPNEIRVAAGNKLYLSFNAVNFSAAITGPAGATARAIATAPWGRAVVFSGAGMALTDAIRFEEGQIVDWSGVATGDQPANGLSAITPLLSTRGFLVAEGEVADLIRDGSLDSLAFYAAQGSGGRVYRLLASSNGFTATLVGPVTASSAGKVLNQAATWPIDDVSARQVAYGQIAAPLLPPLTIASLVDPATVAINRGVNGSGPVGWEQPAAQLTGWSAAILSTASWVDDNLPGAQVIRAAGPSQSLETHYLRQTFTIPAATRIERARLRISMDNFGEAYLNGTRLGEVPFGPNGAVTTLDVPPDRILVGATNLIATRVQNAANGGPMGVAYLLEINYTP